MLAYLAQGTSASGKALESVVEEYFKKKKYNILLRNKKLKPKGPREDRYTVEVDLLVERGNKQTLVECKHKKSHFTMKDLKKYKDQTLDIRDDESINFNPQKLLIISISGFANQVYDNAEEISKKEKNFQIELWDGDDFWEVYYPVASKTEQFFGDLKDTISAWFEGEEEEEYEEEEDWEED